MSREDWLMAALRMCELDIDDVKVARLAAEMGVTTGSFYWHFKNRRELLDAVLEFWEREMTYNAIEAAKRDTAPAGERILNLMQTVMVDNLARYDVAIWHWSRTDINARRVFRRVVKRRFDFAMRMFREAGFSATQAEIRGRMMVVYMMGESTLVPKSLAKRRELVELQHAILTAPEQ